MSNTSNKAHEMLYYMQKPSFNYKEIRNVGATLNLYNLWIFRGTFLEKKGKIMGDFKFKRDQHFQFEHAVRG